MEVLEEFQRFVLAVDIPKSMKFRTPVLSHCSESQALLQGDRDDVKLKRTDFIHNILHYFGPKEESKPCISHCSYRAVQSRSCLSIESVYLGKKFSI